MEKSIVLPENFPDDFPGAKIIGAVGGAQPKLTVILREGKYVANSIEPEVLMERYEICADMLKQLVAYCYRKSESLPSWKLEDVAAATAEAFPTKVRKKNWDFSHEEVVWIAKHLKAHFGELGA